MEKRNIRILIWGGLGDLLLVTPTFAALKKKNEKTKITVYCGRKFQMTVFEHNPHVDKIVYLPPIPMIIQHLLIRLKWIKVYRTDYGKLHPSLYYKKQAAELIAEEIFGISLQDRVIRVYLTGEEDDKAKALLSAYKKPVVINVTPICSENKMWLRERWEELVKRLPELTFIQLGLENEEKVNGAVDLRGKTTFREALAIVKHADSFVGVDSSLSHATNAFDLPGVVLFGASSPDVWAHANNINLYKRFHCAPCIDMLGGSKCPYSSPCMTGITVEEVANALTSQLAKKKKVQFLMK